MGGRKRWWFWSRNQKASGEEVALFLYWRPSAAPRGRLCSLSETQHRGRRPLVEAEVRGRLGSFSPQVIQIRRRPVYIVITRHTNVDAARRNTWAVASKHTRRYSFLFFFYTRLIIMAIRVSCASSQIDQSIDSDRLDKAVCPCH